MARFFLYRKRTGQIQGSQSANNAPESFPDGHPLSWTAADPELSGFDPSGYVGELIFDQANHVVRPPTSQELETFPNGIQADNRQLSRIYLNRDLTESPSLRLVLDLINSLQQQIDALRSGEVVPRPELLTAHQMAEQLVESGAYDLENSSPEFR